MTDDKKALKAASKARKKQAKADAKRAKAAAGRAPVGAESARPGVGEVSTGVERAEPAGPDGSEGPTRTPVRRLVGQGVFQLVIKIIAGLVVAYILIRLGMR
jgi:hypothetical protein